MPEPLTVLQRYLAGEFADEPDFLIVHEDDREPKPATVADKCLLARILPLFTEKGS